MDLIYTNVNREDIGILHDYVFDLAYGSDENNFELTVSTEKHCCTDGCLVYIEGTEYGGIIDGIKIATKRESLTYFGRTWHGVLASKIIEPDAGEAYLYAVGEANTVLAMLIERLGLSELFEASKEDSGLIFNEYCFDRYIDAYKGIQKMLKILSGKLKITFQKGKVVLSAVPLIDYSKDEQFDNDQVDMEISRAYNGVNHLICLGKGELIDRQIIHLFLDENDNISYTRTFTGLKEITEIYDFSAVESLEELEKGGRERLAEYISEKNSLQMDFDSEEKIYDIGDIVGAMEITTKISAVEQIIKKIVTIDKGTVNIEYKVGE